MSHCDDYIDDPKAPACLRTFLAAARAPAIERLGQNNPPLFATYKGKRVRVVMASRFGDVGITSDLKRIYGYEKRVDLEDLSDFTGTPP